MATPTIADPRIRLRDHADRWNVVIEAVHETASSLIASGHRGAAPVVIKLVKHRGDEWNSGGVLDAFDGHGVVRVHEYTGGALLLERLHPGHSLVGSSQGGDDTTATEIIARVIAAMTPGTAPEGCANVQEWGESLDRYLATSESCIPRALVRRARETFTDLARSQRNPRLLHGDLQHSNVLYDRDRGWVAIDPKGVIGEVEYEVGAVFRNPWESPRLFTDPGTIERRLLHLSAALELDRTRVLGWAFAQAVLSAVWSWEDGAPPGPESPILSLADTLLTMLRESPPDGSRADA